MSKSISITDMRLTFSSSEEASSGLLGYVAFTVNGRLRLDGVTVRRTVEGDITLSFPARRDQAGREHPYIRPLDDVTRRELEQAVFGALGIEERVA